MRDSWRTLAVWLVLLAAAVAVLVYIWLASGSQ
jgi:hypothetical protein